MRRKGARSVLPDGAKIDSLRRERGWTIEDFADGAGFSSRTAQTAIAGIGVDVTTLSAIAQRLGVPYDSLLLKPATTPPDIAQGSRNDAGEGVLRLEISLGPASASADKHSLIIAVLESLRGKLPDNARITFLGVTGMTAVVAVAFTPSNALALSEILDEVGIEEIRASDRRTVEDSPFVRGTVGRIAHWIRSGMRGENPIAYSPIGGYALDRVVQGRGKFLLDVGLPEEAYGDPLGAAMRFLAALLPDNQGIEVIGQPESTKARLSVPMTSKNELLLAVMGAAYKKHLGEYPGFLRYELDDYSHNPDRFYLSYCNNPQPGDEANPANVRDLSRWPKYGSTSEAVRITDPEEIRRTIRDLVEHNGYLMRRSALTDRDIVDDRNMQYGFGVPYKGTYHLSSVGADYRWLCRMLGLNEGLGLTEIAQAIQPITDAILEIVAVADQG